MSAPNTNIEKQKSRHAPSLLGVGAAVVFGGVMIVALIAYVLGNADEEDADAVTNANGADAPAATTATE